MESSMDPDRLRSGFGFVFLWGDSPHLQDHVLLPSTPGDLGGAGDNT